MSEQINEQKQKSMNQKLNADFLMFLLQKNTQSYKQMQVLIFSFLNVMNAKKKLGALDQQFKFFLLSRNEEYKRQFLFWWKNEDLSNNFSYQGNEDFTTISYFESKWFLMRP